MPKKEIDIIKVEIQLDLEEEVKTHATTKLSEAATASLEEAVNEQRVLATKIAEKKKERKNQKAGMERVWGILKESFDRAQVDRCTPEPISSEKLLKLYEEETTLSALVQRIKRYIKKEHNGAYALIKKQKNKKSAYCLARLGSE